MRILLAMLAGIVSVIACDRAAAQAPVCPGQPNPSAIKISSIDEAFSIVLNSANRDDRYAATLYLRSKLGDETVKHYGTLLFKVNHPTARLNVYESMGFFGGAANAAVLAHYLAADGSMEAKVKILCSLGFIGRDASKHIQLIQNMKAAYARVYASRSPASGKGSTVIRSGDIEWDIRGDSIPPTRFGLIAEEALGRIRATSTGR